MTIKEIARLAGVSISTVSKIMNNKDESINPETRKRVLKVVKEYNYSPYASARVSSDARTFVLGVLLNSTAKSSLFLNGAISVAQKNGYGLLVYDSLGDQETELKNITTICKSHVDGVIWEPVSETSREYERHFHEYGIEICRINTPEMPDDYYIDFSQISYEATRQLLSYGHTKVGCMIKSGSLRSVMALDGFKKCLLEHGIPYRDNMVLPAESDEWHTRVFAHSLTGVVSTHYASAQLLVNGLAQKRVRIPYDMSLISLRDDFRTPAEPSKISSIRIPYFEFGAFVCERLIETCEKRECRTAKFEMEYPLESAHSLDVPFSSHTKHIVVVGSINIDVTLHVSALPQPGTVTSTNNSYTIPGGKGSNQAVGAAKLGHDVILIGKLGNDYDSNLVYALMEENRVDTQGLLRDPNTETGKAYIHVQSNGESMITILSGANERLSPDDILSHKELFQNAGYCLLQTEVPEITVETAARLAHEYGAKNILKPAAMNTISDSLMQYIDVFIPNRAEANLLCPDFESIEDKAEYFISRGVKSVIITLGHAGCYIRDDSFTGYLPAIRFSTIDTTGAADAFIATLAVYLSEGHAIKQAAEIAAYAAGFSVARQGVIPALIDRNSLDAYIKKINPDIL